MMFNNCKSIDFLPAFSIDGHEIGLVEEMKILGVVITSDLKFSAYTKYMVVRAFKRIWMLRRLKNLGAKEEQLIYVYTKQVRSVLELAAPVWHFSLTLDDKLNFPADNFR
jgi:hypothetical protein